MRGSDESAAECSSSSSSCEIRTVGKTNPAFKTESDDDVSKGKSSCKTIGSIEVFDTNETPSAPLDGNGMLYLLNDVPPWYTSLVCGVQNFLLNVAIFSVPLLFARNLCIGNDETGNLARSNLIGTMFFVTGIGTLLQTTLGTRLPIVQGVSSAHFASIFAILALPHNQCPWENVLPVGYMNSTVRYYNDTDGTIVDANELWQRRIREVQGALVVASSCQVIVALTGLIGFVTRFVGPITLMPMMTVIGLQLMELSVRFCERQWGVALFVLVTIFVSSQYMNKVTIPCPAYNKEKKCHIARLPIFKMFPVLIGLLLGYILCIILTFTNAIPNDPDHSFYGTRIDVRSGVIYSSPWIRYPYPGQWGLPTIGAAGVLGMMAAVIASTAESLGDYYASAKATGAPPLPAHAINRGILMEAISSIIAGASGNITATSSFSDNIALIVLTRVGSRRVVQVTGVIFIVCGLIGKIGSLFASVPDPVIGGMLLTIFAMITSIGFTYLKPVDLSSHRNVFIIGISILLSLAVSRWIDANPREINTGAKALDQIIIVFLHSAMMIAGLLAMILDNTLPGSLESRGLHSWNTAPANRGSVSGSSDETESGYDLPFRTDCLGKLGKYIPVLPSYRSGNEISRLLSTSKV